MKNLLRGLFAFLMVMGMLSVPFAQGPFSDVPEDHWAYKAIQQAVERGILEGYPGNLYMGKRPITRYEMAVIVSRLIAAVEEATGKQVKTPGKNGVTPTGANEEWIKKHFSSQKDFENFKETVNKLSAEFQDELEALGVRVSEVEGRVKKLEKKVKKLGNINISGSIRWRAWRGATDWGDIFNRNQAGSDSGEDQWLKLNLSKKTKEYKIKVSLWDRNWNAGFYGNQLGLVHRRGFGSENTSQFTVAEAYVSADVEKLGTISLGRQSYQWGPVGLLMTTPLGPWYPGTAIWEYDLEKVKLTGLAAIVPNSGNDKVLGGRAEFKLKKEGAKVGVAFVPFGTGDGQNSFGVDAIFPLSNKGSVYGEYVRWDRDVANFNAANNFLIGGDYVGPDKRFGVSLKFADIDSAFSNAFTRFDEDEEGVYRAGFTGVGISGWYNINDKWSVLGDVNKGDDSSPTGWGRLTIQRQITKHVTAAATFIQLGQESASKQTLIRGEVKAQF